MAATSQPLRNESQNNPELVTKLDSPTSQQPHFGAHRGRKFSGIFLLIIMFLGSVGFGIYFYLQNLQLKQQIKNYQTDKATISPKPTVVSLPGTSQDEKDTKLGFTDNDCSVVINYPQLTRSDGSTYTWSVNVSDSTTFISYKDREKPDRGLDHSVVISAQPMGDDSPYNSASIEIVCALNEGNFGLDVFVNKYIEHAGLEYKVSKLSEIIIGGKKFIPVQYKEQDVIVYLGIHKNKLLLLENSNKSVGALQDSAEDILMGVGFVD